ncbi:unnamed protein product [Linum tenue]|uniref:Uncharacterized protein n=1 Tax=Linum tenue TaxID=586396 RepID=A0AAV0R459_9ROSI|nr:unnamed protein product [Linum tenue]
MDDYNINVDGDTMDCSISNDDDKDGASSGDDDMTIGMSSIPGNAGLLRWAVSSLTLKGKPSEQAAPLAPANLATPLTSAASNHLMPALVTTLNSFVMDTHSTVSDRAMSSMDFADQPEPGSPTSTDADGWGEIENGIGEDHNVEKDGWDELEPLEEPKPSPALASIQAAQKRPVVQPVSQAKQPATSLRPKTTAKPPRDEDDDLWGSIAAPAPKIGSKPLNTKPSASFDNDDPWAAIAAPAPTTRAKPLSLGRGRGSKTTAPKLGAQRINRTGSSGGI